jgi:hypothetical protein
LSIYINTMDTSIETIMRQYGETTKNIKIYETYIEKLNEDIDVLTRKIRPQKWLNKVDPDDEMFKLYVLKMRLIEDYDDSIKRLEKHKATQSILLNLIKDKEYRM